MWSKIKTLFKESFCGGVYYQVKMYPPVRLFFDFEYTSALWKRSCIKAQTKRLTEKVFSFRSLPSAKISKTFFSVLLSLCPFLGLWSGSLWHIILITVIPAVYFISVYDNEAIKYAVVYEAAVTLIFAPFLSFSVHTYIIYVETAVILFFIVANLEDLLHRKLLFMTGILWLAHCAFGAGNTAPVTVAFMPYALNLFCRGRVRRYVYGTVILSIGFYALAKSGGAAILGGGVCVLVMAAFGEWWLFLPILLTSPWIIGMGIRVIRQGIFSENIIKTGFFFWSRSFKGVSFDYSSLDFGEYGGFVSVIFMAAAFIFFWYVLRTSRQAILKLFKPDGKNKEILRAGLGAVIGFSLYTFFAKNGGQPGNILLYLWSGALLKRACLKK